MNQITLIGILFILWILTGVSAQCTNPTFLRDTSWWDSDKGSLYFGQSNMTGWTLTTSIVTLPAGVAGWECVHTETDGTDIYLILKDSNTYEAYAETFRAFLCMKLTKITEYSYYYYLMWAEDIGELNHERISAKKESDVGSITDYLGSVCMDRSDPLGPSDNEYHMLVKEGHESDARSDCHPDYYGEYSYSITDIDGSKSYCGNGNETWDVCSSYQHMMFNYSACPQHVAHSVNGSISCLFTMSTGTYTLQTVYNEDNTIAESFGNSRFTCFMSSLDNDGSLAISQSPGSCTKTQTPTTQPTLANSSIVGLNLLLTPHRLCPIVTSTPATTDESQSGLSAGAIAGIVVGIILFIAAAVLIVWACITCVFPMCRNPQHDAKRLHVEESAVDKGRGYACCYKCKGSTKDVIDDQQSPITSPREKIYGLPSTLSDISEEGEDIHQQDISSVRSGQTRSQLDNNNQNAEENAQTLIAAASRIDDISCTNETFTNMQQIDTSASGDDSVVRAFNETDEVVDEHTHSGEIEVTRVLKTENVFTKDLPHLNSTENLFSEYDAAMTYKSDKPYWSESEDTLFSSSAIKSADIKQQKIGKPFEYTRDDSDIDTKSRKKTQTEGNFVKRAHKSEGNLLESVKKSGFQRKSSLKSNIFKDAPIEWNFGYISPYALSIKEKEENAKRKARLERKRKNDDRMSREVRDERRRENIEEFKKWKERKRSENVSKTATDKLYRHTCRSSWFP